jgi:glycosyltransferase involved in cell wall biosynthesis
MTQSIDITIPVLNEERTLDQQVRKVRRYLDEHLSDLAPISIVIADNGSTDATEQIARTLQRELAGVQYIRLGERGVGRALKASWGQSQAAIVGYMDLDLATDLRYLRPAFTALLAENADVVTGSRLANGSRVIGRSMLRGFTSRVLNLFLKLYFSISFTDGMCGFKFLKRERLAAVRQAGADSDGWFFATELLIASEYLGLRIKDLPVEWRDDPDSKVKIGKLAVEYLKAMKHLRQRLPVRVRPAWKQ